MHASSDAGINGMTSFRGQVAIAGGYLYEIFQMVALLCCYFLATIAIVAMFTYVYSVYTGEVPGVLFEALQETLHRLVPHSCRDFVVKLLGDKKKLKKKLKATSRLGSTDPELETSCGTPKVQLLLPPADSPQLDTPSSIVFDCLLLPNQSAELSLPLTSNYESLYHKLESRLTN